MLVNFHFEELVIVQPHYTPLLVLIMKDLNLMSNHSAILMVDM